MLLGARDPDTGEGMSDKQLRDEILTIFLAGHETTANALAWTWVLLSRGPEVARRLRAEVDQVLGGRAAGADDVPKLRYTQMVVKEAMRLYPPAWVISRRALAADTIMGQPVAPGTVVLVSPYVTQRHLGFWDNPEGFDPERFTPEAIERRPRYAYFPFAGGPRQCIGNNFAMMEAELVLATLAQRVKLELQPGHPVVLDPSITLRPRHGLRMFVR
jgi:cytochrome P450